jgi:subtilase family serine protease
MNKRLLGATLITTTIGIISIASFAFAQGLPEQASDTAVEHAQSHAPVCPGPSGKGDARCHAHVATDKGGTPSITTLPAGLSPAQIHAAYATQTTSASPKVIAIVDAYNDPNIYNDLTVYSQTFGIPVLPQCNAPVATATNKPCFQKSNQRGSTTSFPQTNAGWALEIALDVEVAHATCQNCSILLVEADSNSYANLMTAVDRAYTSGANVISNSYGSNEFSGETTFDSHFNHPGVAITVSSGDNGYGAEYPAASPYVTAVGGTSLYLNSDGSYNHETVWSGAGSGCSAFESKPAFQTDSGCSRRTVADVSAVADPNTGAAVYDTVRYSGRSGWFKVGGTSLAAPLIAGIYALSGNTSGAANTLPYANTSALHDVLNGNNGSCGGSYLCTAMSGFDGPTGLGTPNGLAAF